MIVEKAQALEKLIKDYRLKGYLNSAMREDLQRAIFDLYAAVYSATADMHSFIGIPEEAIKSGAQGFLREAIIRLFPCTLDGKQVKGDSQE